MGHRQPARSAEGPAGDPAEHPVRGPAGVPAGVSVGGPGRASPGGPVEQLAAAATSDRVGLGAVWRHGTQYRPMLLLLLLLLASVATSLPLGVLSLFAKQQLATSDVQVTLYFVIVAITGTGVVLVTGQLSDRSVARRPLVRWSFLWLALGYALLSTVRSYPVMIVIGVLFFSALNVTNAQLLALARERVTAHQDPRVSVVVVSMFRIAYSVGSFAGFGLGGLVFGYLDARSVFRVAAGLGLGCLLLSVFALPAGQPAVRAADRLAGRPAAGRSAWLPRLAAGRAALPPAGGGARQAARPAATRTTWGRTGALAAGAADGRRLLLLFSATMVLFASGRVMQVAQLPILMLGSLHSTPQVIGIALAVPPLLEIILMPAVALLAMRWGRGRVFLAGACASVGYYGGLAVVGSMWQLLALQAVYAFFGAATLMVGIDLAQRLLADRAGFATSSYLSHENVAVVNGSLVATVSVQLLGHQTGFLVPAVLCAVACGLSLVLMLRNPVAFDLTRPDPSRPDRARPSLS